MAAEMKARQDDYLPFLTTSEGELLDEAGYSEYCNRLENTHEWGGHVEVR